GEKIEIYDNCLEKPSSTIYPLSQSKVYFEIAYEDKNILIILKEHGITMPSLDNSVRNYLFHKDPTEYQKQIEEFFIVTAVHRLDKVTKGLVIYPKNPVAKRILHRAIGDKTQITKKYLAWCEGSAKKHLPNYVSGYLRKDSREQKMVFTLKDANLETQHCALEIKKVSQKEISAKLLQKFASKYRGSILLEITLHTGRKHQIRSILSFFGMPIIGDKKYGAPSIGDTETSISIVNEKIKLLKGTNKNSISLVKYQRYFDFHKKLGLYEEFTVLTIKDNLLLCGSIIKPILRGYQVVSYDARNHGISSKFSTSLGQIEACDLQDVIAYVKREFQPEKIGLYGFSMGAATCLF
ncbi:12613_t:CDS:2, partial [Funneliformis geosporum]